MMASNAAGGTAGAAPAASALDMGLPLGSAPVAAPASPPAAPAAKPVRIWIGTLRSDDDGRIYWAQQVQRFPDLLRKLRLDLLPVDLGAGQGSWFKVLGGPFAGAAAADKVCRAIKSRSPADDCSVVTN